MTIASIVSVAVASVLLIAVAIVLGRLFMQRAQQQQASELSAVTPELESPADSSVKIVKTKVKIKDKQYTNSGYDITKRVEDLGVEPHPDVTFEFYPKATMPGDYYRDRPEEYENIVVARYKSHNVFTSLSDIERHVNAKAEVILRKAADRSRSGLNKHIIKDERDREILSAVTGVKPMTVLVGSDTQEED